MDKKIGKNVSKTFSGKYILNNKSATVANE